MGKYPLRAPYIRNFTSVLNVLNSIPRTFFVFFILAIGYLSFDLNGNEEQYMLYAKQFVSPDWITSRYLNEFPGTRVIYQYVVGYFLGYFSFEQVHFAFRAILCVLFAVPLGKIYKALQITNVQVLLHLPILFLLHQSLFGGSWMFVSVEPKGFAYVFILFGVYYYLIGRFKTMLIYLILASYFHILVGGYAFMFFMLCLFVFETSVPRLQSLKLFGVYLICLLPFVFYLKTAVVSPQSYSPSVDWIYSYFRHPHHLGLFKDWDYFYSAHFYGVLLSIFALLFSFYMYKKDKVNEQVSRLNHFILLSLVGVLIFVVIAYFDTEGIFLKYYPFRILTLTTLLLTLLLTRIFFSAFKNDFLKVVQLIIVLISLGFIFKLGQPTFKSNYAYLFDAPSTELMEVSTYIKDHTNKDAVILSFMGDLSLNRRMERGRFVVYKFIPADMGMISEWYERELFKRKLRLNFNVINERKDSYKIDYLLSREVIDSKYLEAHFSNSMYHLYKIK